MLEIEVPPLVPVVSVSDYLEPFGGGYGVVVEADWAHWTEIAIDEPMPGNGEIRA